MLKVLQMSLLSFNSQPPEGGWQAAAIQADNKERFNSQPPEGGWFSTQNAASCW